MRVSAACPAELATSTLVDRLRTLGLQPIITPQVIRAVYEGPDKSLGEAIVDIYSHEADHSITVSYDKEEQRKMERKIERKYQRALANAALHGHPYEGEKR